MSAVLPLGALMGLLSSILAALREAARDSFAFAGRGVLVLGSAGDGFADEVTYHQERTRVIKEDRVQKRGLH